MKKVNYFCSLIFLVLHYLVLVIFPNFSSRYEEVCNPGYNFEYGGFSSGTYHFTQVNNKLDVIVRYSIGQKLVGIFFPIDS